MARVRASTEITIDLLKADEVAPVVAEAVTKGLTVVRAGLDGEHRDLFAVVMTTAGIGWGTVVREVLGEMVDFANALGRPDPEATPEPETSAP